MMASTKQIEANRKNALNSTGPITPAGKAVVSTNAIKHGILSSKTLVPGEEPFEFLLFAGRMLENLKPEGELEKWLADKLISNGWRLRRVVEIDALLFKEKGIFDS